MLSDNFYVYPHLAKEIMTSKEYRRELKENEGYIFTHGEIWDIMAKSRGAGMYEVYLKKRFGD